MLYVCRCQVSGWPNDQQQEDGTSKARLKDDDDAQLCSPHFPKIYYHTIIVSQSCSPSSDYSLYTLYHTLWGKIDSVASCVPAAACMHSYSVEHNVSLSHAGWVASVASYMMVLIPAGKMMLMTSVIIFWLVKNENSNTLNSS